MGNRVSSVVEPQEFTTRRKWGITFKRQIKIPMQQVSHASCEEMELCVKVNVELKHGEKLHPGTDHDSFICVPVGVASVSCSTGPLCCASNRTPVENYSTYCSAIAVSLKSDPGDSSDDVRIVNGKSVENPIFHHVRSEARNWRASVHFSGNPEMRVGETQTSTSTTIEIGKQFWSQTLLKDMQNGFFWSCNLSGLAPRRSLLKTLFDKSTRRKRRKSIDNVHDDFWNGVANQGGSDINFASDRYQEEIEWRFAERLLGTKVTWTMDIQLTILILHKRSSRSTPTKVETFPVDETHTFQQKLSKG